MIYWPAPLSQYFFVFLPTFLNFLCISLYFSLLFSLSQHFFVFLPTFLNFPCISLYFSQIFSISPYFSVLFSIFLYFFVFSLAFLSLPVFLCISPYFLSLPVFLYISPYFSLFPRKLIMAWNMITKYVLLGLGMCNGWSFLSPCISIFLDMVDHMQQ